MSRAAILVEVGVLGYLLSVPFGQTLPAPIRTSLLLAILVGLVWLRLVRSPSPRLPPYHMTLPFVCFAASTAISTYLSTSPSFSLEASRFLPVAFLFFFATQDLAARIPAVRRLCAALGATIALLSADCLYQYWLGKSLLAGSGLFWGRVTGSIPHPNDLAVIPIFLPFLLASAAQSRAPALRLAQLVVFALAVAALITSQSRNAWLGTAVALAGWLAIERRYRLVLALSAAAVLLFGAACIFDLAHVRGRLASLLRFLEEGRTGIWLAAWEMFKDAPLAGKGPHVFARHYLEYLVRADLPAGYKPEIAYIPWAHNIYLEMLAERGVLGFGAFLFIVASMARRLLAALRAPEGGTVRPYAGAVAVSLGVFLAMGIFDLTFLKDWVCLVFWMLAGLAARLPDLVPAASPTGPVAAAAPESPPAPSP